MHFQSNTAFEIFGQSLIECSITACIHVYLQLKMSLQDSLYVLAICTVQYPEVSGSYASLSNAMQKMGRSPSMYVVDAVLAQTALINFP